MSMRGEERFVTCYARWADARIVVGNELMERAWRIADGALYAESFVDKRTGRQWLARPARCPAPVLQSPAIAEPACYDIATRYGRVFPTFAPGLQVSIVTGRQTVTALVFPGACGITLQSHPATLQPLSGAPRADLPVASGVESAAPGESNETLPVADAVEHFVLAMRHARLVQVTFRDQTDIHNELVFESEWLLHPAERMLDLQGNLFAIEDPLTGDGLAFLKHAPLPHARPTGAGTDLRVCCARGKGFVPGSSDYGFGYEVGFYGHGVEGASDTPGYRHVVLSYTGGARGRTEALQRHQRDIREYSPQRDGRFLSNTWGDRNRDARIAESFVCKEIEAGAALGVDVTQIDDGWQKGRTSNSAVPGGVWLGFWDADPDFWQAHPQRLPRGLGPIVGAAEQHGMQCGLWFAPDSAHDFANWHRDAEAVLDLHRRWGINYVKIDGVKAVTKTAESNLWRFFERVLRETSGRVVFDLDVTAETRPGYFGMMEVGPVFVENRYTDWHRYWPHQTLRNLWKLAHYVDPARLRMEFLNPSRNADLYRGDPLAPGQYRADALFATVMLASPLGWFEVSGLPPGVTAQAEPLVRTWRLHRDALHSGIVHPIGQAPDGMAWTGFISVESDGRHAHAVVFRGLAHRSQPLSAHRRPAGGSSGRTRPGTHGGVRTGRHHSRTAGFPVGAPRVTPVTEGC